MPETDTIPVSASIASTGKGIRYIGDYAYAYSGALVLETSLIDFLNFTTGTGFIVGKVQINADWAGIAGNTLDTEIN